MKGIGGCRVRCAVVAATFLALAAAGMGLASAAGQVIRVSPSAPVRPQLNLGGSLTVSASPSSVSFTLVPGSVATGSSSIVTYTKANNIGLFNSVSLYAYFSSTSALTSVEGATIAASNVFGYSDAQPSWQAFTASCPFSSNACFLVFRTTSLLDLGLGSGHQNTLSLRIDLTNAAQQPAGTYSGTLTLQAQAL